MLDDFCLEQPIIHKILVNSLKNNRLSHAYLIETNGYSKSLDLAIAFAKYLFCTNNYHNNEKCKTCAQCKNIDKGEYIELKIIQPEGQWIKKSQLEELQNDFSKKTVLGNKKIYIINGADKLNVSSSNSLLKFLEEPEEGIIAILIVENIYQLLSTIVSRCQILSLKPNKKNVNSDTVSKIANELYNNVNDRNEYLSNAESIKNIEYVINFIKHYEENNYNTLIYVNKLWNEYFKDKELLYNAFTILILFYKDVLNIKINHPMEIFFEYVNDIVSISNKNTIDKIIHKINVIIDLREKIKFNINNNALMDKLIISLERSE